MSEKIVARANILIFLPFLLLLLGAINFLNFSFVLFLIVEFIFIFLFIIFLFYNKIELNNNVLTIWIASPMLFKISHAVIDVNSFTQ